LAEENSDMERIGASHKMEKLSLKTKDSLIAKDEGNKVKERTVQGSNRETRARLRPPRYVQEGKPNKKMETSATKCKIPASANTKDGRKKSAKETKQREEKQKEQKQEKDAAEEPTPADGSEEKPTDKFSTRGTDAIKEERREMEKGRDQQKSLQFPAATSPGEGKEKDATSPGREEAKDHRHARVRSLSEGDAIRGEGDERELGDGEEVQWLEATGMNDNCGKVVEGSSGDQQNGGAQERANKREAKCKEEEDLLDILSDSEDSTTTPPPPPPPRRIRKRRQKAKSLGRMDTVVRQMLVRGSKRPPMFPPSADPWPGRL